MWEAGSPESKRPKAQNGSTGWLHHTGGLPHHLSVSQSMQWDKWLSEAKMTVRKEVAAAKVDSSLFPRPKDN